MPAVQTTKLAAAIGISGNAKTLSDVVLWATGRSFDKPPELRTCNWEKRPLSPSQLAYAALNVLGLVQVVSKVSQQGPIKVRVVNSLTTGGDLRNTKTRHQHSVRDKDSCDAPANAKRVRIVKDTMVWMCGSTWPGTYNIGHVVAGCVTKRVRTRRSCEQDQATFEVQLCYA